jgi:hypothetical protein
MRLLPRCFLLGLGFTLAMTFVVFATAWQPAFWSMMPGFWAVGRWFATMAAPRGGPAAFVAAMLGGFPVNVIFYTAALYWLTKLMRLLRRLEAAKPAVAEVEAGKMDAAIG